MRNLKIVLAIFFVLVVSFFVVRSCVHKKSFYYEVEKRIFVTKKKLIPEKVYVQPSGEIVKGPRMAIILDDWGNNFSLVQLAVDLHRPVTLSILPHLPNSERIDAEAAKNNLGVMLHMPMQPKNKSKGLEPHTIMVTNSDKVIVAYLDSALASVPHADGVNNHMGSAATSDERVMKTVLSHLLSKGLFFVDSNTISTSVAPRVAKELGIKFTKRDVFIDNDLKSESVKRYLRRAVAIALKRGRVVVIGHDKKVTLEAIQAMIPEIEKSGVRFVLVKDLVEGN